MRSCLRTRWPWLALLLSVVVALWCVIVPETDLDLEFPGVERPTFSARPPMAYRLAEPGDTIDRVGLYASAAGIALALIGVFRDRNDRDRAALWSAALALELAAFWHRATPYPSPTGWHGLGWQALRNPAAPVWLRIVLAVAVVAVVAVVLIAAARVWPRRREWLESSRARGVLGLLIACVVLVGLSQWEYPGLEPLRYWPRWSFALGMLALSFALMRSLSADGWETRRARRWAALGFVLTLGLIWVGRGVIWFHRPIDRLFEAVPGRIFTSGMPTYEGLALAHARQPFKTIINLFPEDTPLRSPHFPDELRFARENGIAYVAAPADPQEAEAFVRGTLDIARDPAAWPILIHCHAGMDRTPAWLGLYRFVVEGRPLDVVLREIEQHRGCRPKATVTLMYNFYLPRLDAARNATDPTAALLRDNARDVLEPGSEPRAALTHLADDTARRP